MKMGRALRSSLHQTKIIKTIQSRSIIPSTDLSGIYRADLGHHGLLRLAEEGFALDGSDSLRVQLPHGLPRQPGVGGEEEGLG